MTVLLPPGIKGLKCTGRNLSISSNDLSNKNASSSRNFYKQRISDSYFFIKTKQNKKLLLKWLLTGTQCSEATLLKKRLWRRCFPVNFAKFLRTPILQNTSGGCFWMPFHHFVNNSYHKRFRHSDCSSW